MLYYFDIFIDILFPSFDSTSHKTHFAFLHKLPEYLQLMVFFEIWLNFLMKEVRLLAHKLDKVKILITKVWAIVDDSKGFE